MNPRKTNGNGRIFSFFLLGICLLLALGGASGQSLPGEMQSTEPVYPGYYTNFIAFSTGRTNPLWRLDVPVKPEYKHVPGKQTPDNGIWVAVFPGGCGIAGFFTCNVGLNPTELSFQETFTGPLAGCGGGGGGGGSPNTWTAIGKTGNYFVIPDMTNICVACGCSVTFQAVDNLPPGFPVFSTWTSAPVLALPLPPGTSVTVTSPTNPGVYTITGKASSPATGTDSAILTVLKVEINKILSDQFSGADVNRLPPIGSWPSKNIPMLMGCAIFETAKIKVEATVSPILAPNPAYVGVRKLGTSLLWDYHEINSGGQTPLRWGSPEKDALYEIVAGVDSDGDSILDPEEVCVVYPDPVRVFNIEEYDDDVAFLALTTVAGWLALKPTAANLLLFFLANSGNDTTVSLTDPRLYHPVGVQWAGTSGSCSKNNFANLEKVVGTIELRARLLSAAISDPAHYAEIATYFSSYPGDTHTFGPWSCSLPSFGFSYGLGGVDDDMAFSFGGVETVTVDSYQLTLHDNGMLNWVAVGLSAQGHFYDLYDFDIFGAYPSAFAAPVQAGYPTLGDAGRVFQVDRVNFNGTWPPSWPLWP